MGRKNKKWEPPSKKELFYYLAEEFIENNHSEIVKKVNAEFQASEQEIADVLTKELSSYISEDTPHYEWVFDGCPWDRSGELEINGTINLEQTVEEFLTWEYTGEWSPTFERGHGKNYDTYDEPLSYVGYNLAIDIMYRAVRKYIVQWATSITTQEIEKYLEYPTELLAEDVKKFAEELTEDSFSDFFRNLSDPIYSDSITFSFFSAMPAVEFVGLDQKLVKDFL